MCHGQRAHLAPTGLAGSDLSQEEIIQEEVLKHRVLVERFLDVAQELRADNATSSPHEGSCSTVDVPLVLIRCGADQDKALGVRHDLGRVQGLTDGLHQLRAVTLVLWGLGTRQNGACGHPLGLLRAEAASKHGLADESQGHAQVQCGDGGPLAGSLLPSLVHDLIQNVAAAVFLFLGQNVSGDFDEETVQVAFVPFGKHVMHLRVGHSQNVLHHVVCLTAELHVSVFDAIVHHLDVMPRTIITEPIAARHAPIHFGGDVLKHLLDQGPPLFCSTRHDRRTKKSTFLAPGNTTPNEVDPRFATSFRATVCVIEVGVATIDDNVTLLHEGDQLVNPNVGDFAGHHHQHHLSGRCDLREELFHRVCTNNVLALGSAREEFINFGGSAVVHGHHVTLALEVEHQVLTHHGQPDETDVSQLLFLLAPNNFDEVMCHSCLLVVEAEGGCGLGVNARTVSALADHGV
mmetsp:Transcript_1722/g.1889  ORF Transcript_1722/g.1889 Transcript_1722/m.1889 type:complete len:461 (-) Transcript_1722:3-1385(-)